MNTIERNSFVKSTAVEGMNIGNAVQIDDFSYAVPVDVEGMTCYAKIVVTACDMKGSKTHGAFDIDAAVTDYAQKCADRQKVADEKARKKTEKDAKKAENSKVQ